MSELQRILKMSLDRGASDIHLVAGLRPLLRIHTELAQVEEVDV